jgi:uncharacterized protein YbgA (DUF1722 family)/uncharacterized protein YbbK (DUF523 family)
VVNDWWRFRAMRDFPRPAVVSSKCLEFEACRYNGVMIPSPVVRELEPFVDFNPVCPEVEIGLGVPRPTIRIVEAGGERRLMQPETGRDVTRDMKDFTGAFLDGVGAVDGFILKFRSPSCGIKDVKVYPGIDTRSPVSRGAGFFGGEVLSRFGGLAIEDEGRLKNFKIREHFLTQLFTISDFRRTESKRSMGALVDFHTDNKFLLMAYGQKHMRELGRVVANPGRDPVSQVLEKYSAGLRQALARPPRSTSALNVLMHGLGYFSKELSHSEKAYFLDSLEAFRAQRVPLSVPVSILRSYVVRFEEAYLGRQTFFEPYPVALVNVTDSGKGRDL